MEGKFSFDSLPSLAMERGQAGWRLNGAYTPGDDTKLIPRFRPFLETDLNGTDVNAASAKAGAIKVRYDLLARAIPALSYAAAVDPIPPSPTGAAVQNFDLEDLGRVSGKWPVEGHGGDFADRWLHSDFRAVALPYVYLMYESMISKGNLDAN